MGLRGNAAIYAAVRRRPMTYTAIAQAAGVTLHSARYWAQSLHTAGLLRVHSWVSIGRGQPTPRWQATPGADAPYPTHRPDGSPTTPRPVRSITRRYLSTVTFCAALQALQDGPHTLAELVAETGAGLRAIRKMVCEMHAHGLVHISAWHRALGATGKWSPVYSAGTGRNCPKPEPEPNTASCRRHRQKQKLRSTLQALHSLPTLASNQPQMQAAA